MIKSPSVFGFSSTSHLFCWSFFLRSSSEADKSDLESESEEARVDGFCTGRGRFFFRLLWFLGVDRGRGGVPAGGRRIFPVGELTHLKLI